MEQYKQAKEKAEQEYNLFNPKQQIDSDFDKEVKKILGKNSYKEK